MNRSGQCWTQSSCTVSALSSSSFLSIKLQGRATQRTLEAAVGIIRHTGRGSWALQYLPWMISPWSLFWQYRRNASSSSIWEEMVQGSPNKKSNTQVNLPFKNFNESNMYQLLVLPFFQSLDIKWHFDQSQSGTTQLFLPVSSKLSRQSYPIG